MNFGLLQSTKSDFPYFAEIVTTRYLVLSAVFVIWDSLLGLWSCRPLLASVQWQQHNDEQALQTDKLWKHARTNANNDLAAHFKAYK